LKTLDIENNLWNVEEYVVGIWIKVPICQYQVEIEVWIQKRKKLSWKKKFTLLSYHWDCLNFPFNILHKEGHQKVLPNFGNVNSFE